MNRTHVVVALVGAAGLLTVALVALGVMGVSSLVWVLLAAARLVRWLR